MDGEGASAARTPGVVRWLTCLDAPKILSLLENTLHDSPPPGISPVYIDAFFARHRSHLIRQLCQRLPLPEVRTTHKAMWPVHPGVVDDPWSGIDGQLTVLEVPGVGAIAVREHLAMRSFLMGSSERWGLKHGKIPSDAVKVLELLAPEEHWPVLAVVVRRLDGLDRPVRRNRNFTWSWVRATLARWARKDTPDYWVWGEVLEGRE